MTTPTAKPSFDLTKPTVKPIYVMSKSSKGLVKPAIKTRHSKTYNAEINLAKACSTYNQAKLMYTQPTAKPN